MSSSPSSPASPVLPDTGLVFELLDGSKGDFHYALLEKFHAMCCIEFSGENEMESFDVWRSVLGKQPAPGDVNGLVLTFIVCFRDPQQQQQHQQEEGGEATTAKTTELELLGGTQQEFYLGSQCGLLPYVVVSPAARGMGLSRKLVQRAHAFLQQQCASLCGAPMRELIIELSQKSDANPEGDSSDYHSLEAAQTRHRIWESLGFRGLAFSFQHPGPLRNTLHQLAVYRPKDLDPALRERTVPVATLRRFLRAEFMGIMLPTGATVDEVDAELEIDFKKWLPADSDVVTLGEWR